MPNLSKTISSALKQAANKWPDHRALCTKNRFWTWKELNEDVERIASYWVSKGVGPKDVVAVLIDKRAEVVLTFFVCCRIGAIYCPVNFKLHLKHIRDQLQTAQASVFVTQANRERILFGVDDLLPKSKHVFSVDSSERWNFFSPSEEYPEVEHTPHADDICYLNYTSGSTGRPKGAETSHRHILSNARDTIESLDFKPSDVFLGMFSVFSHPHELFHRSLLTGGAFVIIDSLSPRVIAESIEKWKVTWMMAVPSFYEMMARFKPNRTVAPNLSSLRILESGGAYVSAQVVERMEKTFNAQFIPVWGCTEATGVVLANQHHRKTGATGQVISGYRAKIVNESGSLVEPGEVGELLISGDSVVSSYLGQADESKSAFDNGWYRTGDLMIEMETGLFRFVSRRSEMLKVGGIRVYPLEIEMVILKHHFVSACVVVRAVEELRGEVPHAIIQVTEGETLSEAEVIRFCAQSMARYKVPRKVSFWESIPLLPNGKVDKRSLREKLQ
jgi:long-chain acyl-CoA synthetase